jgi:hypothetical protein
MSCRIRSANRSNADRTKTPAQYAKQINTPTAITMPSLIVATPLKTTATAELRP